MSSLEIVRLINREDATVAAAVGRALPQIARAIDLIVAGLREGGRLIYVGAGTSGRLGALDASEIPPTFNTDPRMVQYIMAGGAKALAASTEASEDDTELAVKEMKKRKPGKHDIVLGIATSGRTPFTIAAVEFARSRGARTIALTCNRDSPLERASAFAIVTEVAFSITATGTSPRRSIVSGSSASSCSRRLAQARPAVPPPKIATPTSISSSSGSRPRFTNSLTESTGGGKAAGATLPLLEPPWPDTVSLPSWPSQPL